MFEWIVSPEAWIALITLIGLEVVLGVDNIIFISILVAKLPEHERHKARQIGLILAMLSRLVLLFCIVWVMGLIEPWFYLFGNFYYRIVIKINPWHSIIRFRCIWLFFN